MAWDVHVSNLGLFPKKLIKRQTLKGKAAELKMLIKIVADLPRREKST
jgi:hypothetical protein